jgi:hypothetical protein
MAKPRATKATKPSAARPAAADDMVSVNLRIPLALLEAVDARVEAMNVAEPERWPRMTRLDWIRTALAQAVKREAP